MAKPDRKPITHYMELRYSFNVIADPDSGYVIDYPDLPGCITQVESLHEISTTAEDARSLWIETTYELGQDVPLPGQLGESDEAACASGRRG